MTRWKPAAVVPLVLSLCLLGTPVVHAQARAASATTAAPAPAATTPRRHRLPATRAELEQYAKRELKADKLEDFEGGRGGALDVTTLVIVLLIVLIVVIVV